MFSWIRTKLGSKTPGMHAEAPEKLEKATEPRSVEQLVATLWDSNSPINLRAYAARQLGAIGDAQAISALVCVLQDDADVLLGFAAEGALERCGTTAVEPLLTVLKSDSVNVRQRAVRVLGSIGDKRAITSLVLRLLEVEVPIIHFEAERALKKIDPNWSSSDDAKAAVPALEAAFYSSSAGPKVRQKALFVLQSIEPNWVPSVGKTSDMSELLQSLTKGGEIGVAAAVVLEKINPNWRNSKEAKAVVSSLSKSLDAQSSYDLQFSSQLLAAIGDKHAIEALMLVCARQLEPGGTFFSSLVNVYLTRYEELTRIGGNRMRPKLPFLQS